MSNINKDTLIDVPMPILTERLFIRPAMAGDGQKAFDAIEETYDDLAQWMPWTKNHSTIENTEAICRESYANFLLRKDMMVFAFDHANKKFIGSSGLHRFNWSTRRFEVGYWIRKSEQGKGYATEIANALTRFAFEALNARAVMIGHADGNEKSKNVIQKLGFEQEGRAKFDHELPNGDFVDGLTYSRTNTQGMPELKIKYGGELWSEMQIY